MIAGSVGQGWSEACILSTPLGREGQEVWIYTGAGCSTGKSLRKILEAFQGTARRQLLMRLKIHEALVVGCCKCFGVSHVRHVPPGPEI